MTLLYNFLDFTIVNLSNFIYSQFHLLLYCSIISTIKDGVETHWEDVFSNKVETTAYGLLIFLEMGDLKEAAKAAKWLMSERNSIGGFSSRQVLSHSLDSGF